MLFGKFTCQSPYKITKNIQAFDHVPKFQTLCTLQVTMALDYVLFLATYFLSFKFQFLKKNDLVILSSKRTCLLKSQLNQDKRWSVSSFNFIESQVRPFLSMGHQTTYMYMYQLTPYIFEWNTASSYALNTIFVIIVQQANACFNVVTLLVVLEVKGRLQRAFWF